MKPKLFIIVLHFNVISSLAKENQSRIFASLKNYEISSYDAKLLVSEKLYSDGLLNIHK